MLNASETLDFLHSATQYCKEQNYKAFSELLNKNPTYSVDNKTADGWSLLHIASYFDFSLAVTLLLKKGANINIEEKNGTTPLLMAVSNNSVSCVDTLLQHDALIDKANKKGFTPLMSASFNGNQEILEILIEKNPNLELQDNKGKNVFDYAEEKNHNNAVRSILEKTKIEKIDSFLRLNEVTKKNNFKL